MSWLEHFESGRPAWSSTTAGGSSEPSATVLFVADRAADAAETAFPLTERGADHDDPFPEVRAGLAHGAVVSRLGDVFGPTVNIAARLTSVARPGHVLVDLGAHDEPEADRRTCCAACATAMKGYARLQPFALCAAPDPGGGRETRRGGLG